LAIPPLAGHLVVEVGMPVVTDEDGSSRRRRGRYPKQFCWDAAALVIDQHRTVSDVARELGVIEQTLGNWVRQERIDRGEREGTTTQMREENARCRREVKRLEMERDLQSEVWSSWVLEQDRSSRYWFVSTMGAEGFPVRAACEAAEVSSSAYYEWCAKVAASPSTREWEEALVVNEMLDVHAHHDDTYGSPRMTAELRRRGWCVNHKRTERLMGGVPSPVENRRRMRVPGGDVKRRL